MNQLRMTIANLKKEVAKHPKIDFLTPSKGRSQELKIDEDFTIFINKDRLSTGNSKLKDIFIFNLPVGAKSQGGSCLNSKSCFKDCYARKAERLYINARILRYTNLYLMLANRKLLKTLVNKQIRAKKRNPITTFRIHESGDFNGQSEINFWNNIIGENPTINFYAYTKVNKILNFTKINSNKNFNLITSLLEDNKGIAYRNFGKPDYVNRIAKKVEGFVCPATFKDNDVTCNQGCTYCVFNKKPLFYIH